MQKECMDEFFTTFSSYLMMEDYHENLTANSKWIRCKVNEIKVRALDATSALFSRLSDFALGTSQDAVDDTASNLGLAIEIQGQTFPVRTTAYKSLLDRAKVGGTALPKLAREHLAEVLNHCLSLYKAEALLLVRDEKVSAVHSGDSCDYSILPIDELLKTLQNKLNARFPNNQFKEGYTDHALTSAAWTMPVQKDDLIGSYTKLLDSMGKGKMASKLVPGIRFMTSDTGIASAKVSALLVGGQCPIHIGSCISVDHRHNARVGDFEAALDQLFAQFGDSVKKLEKLLEINLDYPVNAMTRVCKKLSMPKKAATEAISMFEMAHGTGPATAHDVFMAMQEIPFNLKTQNTPESKMLIIEENMARALTIRWSDYDLAKAVSY